MKRKHLKRIAKYIARRIERDCNWQMNLTLTKRADDPSYAGEWVSDGEGGRVGIESVEVTPTPTTTQTGYVESFDKPGDAPSPVAPPGAVDAAVPDGWVVLEWSMSCLGYRGLWHPSKMRDADGGVWYRDGVGGDR